MRTSVWMLATAAVLLSSGASAFTYDEATDGDILDSPNNPTFALDAGANTVSGTQSVFVSTTNGISSDRDNFYFVVPVGLALSGVSISWGNWIVEGAGTSIITGAGHLNGLLSCSLLDAGNNPIATVGTGFNDQCVQLSAAETGQRDLFSSVLALGAGTYGWYNVRALYYLVNPDQSPAADGSWSLDYTLTFMLREVPEPGSLALLGLGLAGLGFARRRKAA